MLTDAVPGRWSRALLLVVLATTLWGGCSPDDFLVADEDRERNFQRARDAERLGEFEAASEYYERALERNSRSAAVHLSYASLCEGQLRRYADAVYHYQRYLRLLPDDPKADDIRRRITNCTERLATSVPLVIRSETIARDLEAVRNENLNLHRQTTNLLISSIYWSNECRRATITLAQVQNEVLQLQNQVRALSSQTSPAPSPAGSGATAPAGTSPAKPPAGSASSAGSPTYPSRSYTRPPDSSLTTRIHRVQPGETMDRIARQYGLPLRTLQLANPRVEPRRLKAGTELRIPARTP